jgi:hypothetical protein
LTGFGQRRDDAVDTSGKQIDYKSHRENTDASGQGNLRHSIAGYLKVAKPTNLKFSSAQAPSWAYRMAREEAQKTPPLQGSDIYFNGELVIKNGQYVSYDITSFATPQASPVNNNNNTPPVPRPTTPSLPVEPAKIEPSPKKIKTSQPTKPAPNTLDKYFFKKPPDQDKDPPGNTV